MADQILRGTAAQLVALSDIPVGTMGITSDTGEVFVGEGKSGANTTVLVSAGATGVTSVAGKTGAVALVADDMSDIDTTTAAPAVGEGLVWDGTNWVPGTVGGALGSIDTLSDVDTTSAAPTVGQGLQWDGTNWVPATFAGGVTSLDDLSDVDTTTVVPTSGDGLRFDGSNWTPVESLNTDLSGTPYGLGTILVANGTDYVDVGAGADGEVLSANSAQPAGVEWVASAAGSWTGLSDTAGALVADEIPRVNAGGTALEFGAQLTNIADVQDHDVTAITNNSILWFEPTSDTWQVRASNTLVPLITHTESFLTTDWVLSGGNRILSVTSATHGLVLPKGVFVYEDDGSLFNLQYPAVSIRQSDQLVSITVADGSEFDGQVVIF